MKKTIKISLFLMLALFLLVGIGMFSKENSNAALASSSSLCEWYDSPGSPADGCKVLVFETPCLCESEEQN
ncbi:hypothetical protein [Pararhodonellum marinum]|uniref:hypothetical protein n=1 Tax=Pararhodonellum marinum TaxID=2755358 RepID=UPI0018904B21|nr:hypothetical protein [Pararhodonellum marinum]